MGCSQAPPGFVRPACGHPSRPQPLPAPPIPSPAAEERRPGGRCGLGRERRKVSGGSARRAPVCRVRGEDARHLAGGEPPRARGPGWAGGCALAGWVLGWAERTGFLRPQGAPRAGASPTWNRAPSSWERREPPVRPWDPPPRGGEEPSWG